MAAYTTSQAGNWNVASTWGGAGVPGNGDTVILTKAVTVTTNTIVGASNGIYASGSNAAAFQLNSGGQLILGTGVKLTVRGDFNINTGYAVAGTGITYGPGSIIEIDSSTTSPTTTAYRLLLSSGSNAPGFSIVANGTKAQPCYFQSNPGGANAYVYVPAGTSNCGALSGSYLNFVNIGSASQYAWYISYNNGSPGATINASNFTWTGCGDIFVQDSASSGMTNVLNNCTFSLSLGSTNITSTYYLNATNCVFDQRVPAHVGSTFNGCYLGDGYTSNQDGNAWALFQNNIVRMPYVQATAMQGNVTNAYMWMDHNTANPHFSVLNSALGVLTLRNILYGYSSNDGTGDCVTMGSSPGSATTHLLRNCLGLPNAGGENSGTVVSMGGSGQPNVYTDVQHVTHLVGSQGVTVNETNNCQAGQVANLKSNILWDSANYTRGAVLQDVGNTGSAGSQPTDVVAPTHADYNNSYGVQRSIPAYSWFAHQGNGYAANFSATPGAHDNTLNPQFVDRSRNIETFDSAYLKNSYAEWSSYAAGHTFNVGDFVSHAVAGNYGSVVINYRCIQQHSNSTPGTEPGGSFTSSWRQQWEFASAYRIRTAITNGLSITDPSIVNTPLTGTAGLVNAGYGFACMAWVFLGFAPQNTSLRGAAADGGDIGAVLVRGATQSHCLMGCS